MPKHRLSLKARALGWLAQREHSRSELKRKLLRVARLEQAQRQAQAQVTGVVEGEAARPVDAVGGVCTDPEHCVEQLLDWLQAHRYLSEARFAESRIHARSARYGNLRIRQELAQHGVELDAAALQQLKESELARAREVWRRKFGAPADDAHGRARQMRFLAQRGFSADVIRRVVQADED